ncbi:MAG TPA: hypothetical protein PKD01_02945 [Mesorhizobium sp.]|nr:hypothetical protein [Mesorhizobium sp.]
MRIDGTASWMPAMAGTGSTATQPLEAGRLRENVDTARNTAMSALHNDRFSRVLDWLSDPRSSEAAMLMRPDTGGQVDHATAASRYAENSE